MSLKEKAKDLAKSYEESGKVKKGAILAGISILGGLSFLLASAATYSGIKRLSKDKNEE
jgi:hypothetical protein